MIDDCGFLIFDGRLRGAVALVQAHIINQQSSIIWRQPSPERRGRRSEVSNNQPKGKAENEQLKAAGETRREPTRSERTDHPPEASLGWRPEMASSSVGSEP